jgi:hypothetical protein
VLWRRLAGSILAISVGWVSLGAQGNPFSTSQLSWTPRGAYSGVEFTSIESPPGFPCVVAFTALQNGGLRVSTDCGVQYADLLFASAHAVTAKNDLIGYVAVGNAGMIKTVDQGFSWFPINDGLPLGADARDVLIHVGNADTVYCGLMGDGVFFGGPMQDSLIGWTPMNDGLGDLRVRCLSRVRGGTYFVAGTESGIWRYTEGSWSLAAPGILANTLVIDAADSARVYAGTETGVYRSINAGQSFFLSSTGLPAGVPVNDIARRTDSPQYLYVGLRGEGVYESSNYGASWESFGPVVPGENDVRAVHAAVDIDVARVFAGTRVDGLYEAQYTVQTKPTTWGRLKDVYR